MRKVIVYLIVVFLHFASMASADLVGLWQFDEGSGTEAYDASGFNNHFGLWNAPDGLVNGSSAPSTMPRWISHSSHGTALEFCTMSNGSLPDSSNQNWNYAYLISGRSDSLNNLGTRWTITLWINQYVNDPAINIGGGGGYQRVISCPAYEIELGTANDRTDYFWPYYPDGSTGTFDKAIGATQSLKQWYHMALVYDGVNLIKYINGSPVFSTPIASEFLPATWDNWEYLRLARQTDQAKDYFIGALDDVAIFNQALSQTQIQTIMSGDFSGPWTKISVEDDSPITYLWDPSFIIRYNNGQVVLDFDEKAQGKSSWNWQVNEQITDPNNNDPNFWGLANAGLWDGDATNIEYAGYCTIDDTISQVALGRRAFADIQYELKARIGGENAIGNIVGVKFYRVDLESPYGNEVLIADLQKNITANKTWFDVSTLYTSTATDHNQRFKAVCYVQQGTGPGRGESFGYFDFVRIDPVAFMTCQARIDYNFGNSGLTGDLNNDCQVELNDYTLLSEQWQTIFPPEPDIKNGELLINPDFYYNLDQVPGNGDFTGMTPFGWQFVPPTDDPAVAGIQNVSQSGAAANQASQPAGGSVAAYIDATTDLQQTVTATPIENGKTYNCSAMIAGTGGAYLSMLTMILEYVDDPDNPGIVVPVASSEYIMPEYLVWREISTEFTADADAHGRFLRLRFEFGPNPFPDSTAAGYGVIGKASITISQPSACRRNNLLVNGDFEDYSSLSMGTNNNDGWLDLFSYVNHFTMNNIPGWDTSSNAAYYFGLQCMLWAPAPQPATGRISAWFTNKIEQKITGETIQNGQTYYLDFLACINGSQYVSGTSWPAKDPNMVVDIYWLTSRQNKPLAGNLIASLKAPIVGPLVGNPDYNNSPYTPWLSAETSFTADATMAGNYFYVSARCDDPAVLYPTFEEIYLSKEPRTPVGPYTCQQQMEISGLTISTDLNNDCSVDLDDLLLLAAHWLTCNDPAICP